MGKIPLLPWFPFFAAALRRERQSGFLFPQFGVSSRKGFFAKIPYFWAIDDSQDLTVSLDAYTERGIGATAEYRYILSQESAGACSGFMISEIFKRQRHARGLASYKHAWQVTPRLSVKVDANVVSDDNLLRDYADRLSERTQQRAETNVFVSQRWDSWSLVGNILWYQDLTTSRPVELQRVPDIRLEGLRQPVPGLPGFLYEMRASATYFFRDVGSEGPRVDLHPRIFRPIPVAGLFTVTPFAGGRAHVLRQAGGQPAHDHRGRSSHSSRRRWTTTTSGCRSRAAWRLESRISRVWTVDGTWGLAAVQHVIEPRVTLDGDPRAGPEGQSPVRPRHRQHRQAEPS